MTTIVSRRLAASPDRVFRALVDPADIAAWRYPAGMSCVIDEFDAREGGRVRVSLTYDGTDRRGKTSARTDTYTGRFVTVVPNELLVEVDRFETDDPLMSGEMTMTIRLTAAPGGGTDLEATHEGLPAGVSAADNELGWHQALDRLAKLVEIPPGDA